MTAYFLYLVEASIWLALLYLIYILFLKEDTFFKLNRFYLLGSVIVSLIIPALPHSGLVKSIEQPLKNKIPKQTLSVMNLTGLNLIFTLSKLS